MFGSADELFQLKVCGIEERDLVVCDRSDNTVRYTLKVSFLPDAFPCTASESLLNLFRFNFVNMW